MPEPSDNASRYPIKNNQRISSSRVGDSLSPRQIEEPQSVELSWTPTSVPENHDNSASPRSAKTGDFRTPAAVSDFVEGNSALAITRKVSIITSKDG